MRTIAGWSRALYQRMNIPFLDFKTKLSSRIVAVSKAISLLSDTQTPTAVVVGSL
jgi:hypothetical protein